MPLNKRQIISDQILIYNLAEYSKPKQDLHKQEYEDIMFENKDVYEELIEDEYYNKLNK